MRSWSGPQPNSAFLYLTAMDAMYKARPPRPCSAAPHKGGYPSSMLLAAPGVFEHDGMMFMPPWLLTMLPSHAGKSFEAWSVCARNPVYKPDQTYALAGCARLLTSQAVRLRRSAPTRCT